MHKRIRKSHFLMGLIVLSIMLSANIGVARGQDAPPIEMMGGWQPGPEAYHPTRLIIRFADNAMTTAAATDSIQSLGYSLQSTVNFRPSASFPSGLRFGAVEIPEHEDIDSAMARLSGLPGIMYAERRHRLSCRIQPG